MLKYKYLYNELNELVKVEKAVKGVLYKMYLNSSLDYIFISEYTKTDGTFVRGHFALKTNNPFASLGLTTNESEEHYNAKMEIVYNKKYYDTIFKKWVEFDEVKPEIKQGNKRPDLSCYIDNILVCCIEICVGNKKNELDILQLKKLNVPIIELENERTRHLILSEVLEFNKQQYSEINAKIEQAEQRYRQLANELQPEINTIERQISQRYLPKENEIVNWIFRRKKREFKEIQRISTESNDIRTAKEIDIEIRNLENRIEKIKYSRDKQLDRIDQLKNEIATTETTFNKIAKNCRIEWFRNTWITHTPTDLIKEIKYWLC